MTTILRALPVLVLALIGAAAAAAAEPVEGKDYFRVDPPMAPADAKQLVVTEFFSYQCPHCDRFAKPFADWASKLPKDVRAERAAVAIGHQAWMPAAQAFYALSALKAVPALDGPLFDAIHRERRALTSEVGFADWVAGQGIDRAAFLNAYRSFSVQLKTRRADELSRQARLPSIPALLIDGRYLVAVTDDGDFGDQLALARALIDRARRERGTALPTS